MRAKLTQQFERSADGQLSARKYAFLARSFGTRPTAASSASARFTCITVAPSPRPNWRSTIPSLKLTKSRWFSASLLSGTLGSLGPPGITTSKGAPCGSIPDPRMSRLPKPVSPALYIKFRRLRQDTAESTVTAILFLSPRRGTRASISAGSACTDGNVIAASAALSLSETTSEPLASRCTTSNGLSGGAAAQACGSANTTVTAITASTSPLQTFRDMPVIKAQVRSISAFAPSSNAPMPRYWNRFSEQESPIRRKALGLF